MTIPDDYEKKICFIREKAKKINKSPIILNHEFDKKKLTKYLSPPSFSIYHYENGRVDS